MEMREKFKINENDGLLSGESSGIRACSRMEEASRRSSTSVKIKCKMEYISVGFPFCLLVFVWLNLSLLNSHEETMKRHASLSVNSNVIEVATRTNSVAFDSRQFHKVAEGIVPASANKSMSVRRGPKPIPATRQKRKPKSNQKMNVVNPGQVSLGANATVSACLLIRDDNDILPEWLAYHYHAMGLRYLIMAVDPLSKEYPTDIAAKWKLMTDLEILEWTDEDYMPHDFLKTKRPPEQYMQKEENFPDAKALLEVSNHRYRQRVFLAKCLRRFHEDGRSWVLHTDTDEFIVASKLLRQMKPEYLRIPPMDEPNSVLSLLQQAVEKTPKQVNYPCMSLLRVLFGAAESNREDRERDVPEGFNSQSFETLRWRHHALPHNMTLNGNPKVLLDVSAIPKHYFRNDIVFSIHRPMRSLCHMNSELSYTKFRQQPIGVNHYLGTWERYSSRNDKRRSRDLYEAKAPVHRGTDDGIRLWLKGFCQSVGNDVAMALLGKSYLQQ